MTRLKLDLTEDQAKKISEIAARGREASEHEVVRHLLSLISLVDQLHNQDKPVVVDLGDLQISNKAYRDARISEEALELIATSKETTDTESGSFGSRIYDSVELKPGLFGFKIDLKKLPMPWRPN